MKKIYILLTFFCLFLTSCNLNNLTTDEKDYTQLFPSVPSIPTLEVPSFNENGSNETTITNNIDINVETILSTENKNVESIEQSIIDVIEYADKSTVMIKTSINKINEFEYQGFGSGVIYNKNEENNTYTVLTNKHVVENSNYFKIKTIYEEVDAYVYGIASNYDVAIMYFKSEFDYNITKIEINENIKKGQYAIAIGTPLDEEYFNSVSVGNISLISENYIKHTASLNSGNSGGPLYNLNGNLIGLNYQKLSGESNSGASIEGQFFAISLNDINEAIKDITSIKLGITVTDISNILEYFNIVNKMPSYSNYFDIETQKFYNEALKYIPEGITTGVIILSVEKTGIAYQKLEEFDIIYKINDTNISKTTDIRNVLVNYQKDTPLTTYIYRNKMETIISIFD